MSTTSSTNHTLIEIAFGMGCFWGAERRFREILQRQSIEVGYANGEAAITDYQTVLATEKARQMGLSELQNHAEVVKISYDPQETALEQIFKVFWESHDPTQGDRQGNDIGSNYRSGIYYSTAQQKQLAEQSKQRYQQQLTQHGFDAITTEIAPLTNYNRAEEAHQRYLQKHPNGYCGLGGLGVTYPE